MSSICVVKLYFAYLVFPFKYTHTCMGWAGVKYYSIQICIIIGRYIIIAIYYLYCTQKENKNHIVQHTNFLLSYIATAQCITAGSKLLAREKLFWQFKAGNRKNVSARRTLSKQRSPASLCAQKKCFYVVFLTFYTNKKSNHALSSQYVINLTINF